MHHFNLSGVINAASGDVMSTLTARGGVGGGSTEVLPGKWVSFNISIVSSVVHLWPSGLVKSPISALFSLFSRLFRSAVTTVLLISQIIFCQFLRLAFRQAFLKILRADLGLGVKCDVGESMDSSAKPRVLRVSSAKPRVLSRSSANSTSAKP